MLAKFQYFSDALEFAKSQAAKVSAEDTYFYLAICDHENKFQCFFRPKATEAAS